MWHGLWSLRRGVHPNVESWDEKLRGTLKSREGSAENGCAPRLLLADFGVFSQLLRVLAVEMRRVSGESSEPFEQKNRSLQIASLDRLHQVIRSRAPDRQQPSAGRIMELPLSRVNGRDERPIFALSPVHRLAADADCASHSGHRLAAQKQLNSQELLRSERFCGALWRWVVWLLHGGLNRVWGWWNPVTDW